MRSSSSLSDMFGPCALRTTWLFVCFVSPGYEHSLFYRGDSFFIVNILFHPQSAFYPWSAVCGLHFTPGLQSAVCILPSVCILPPVCSLQSAVCILHWPVWLLAKGYFTFEQTPLIPYTWKTAHKKIVINHSFGFTRLFTLPAINFALVHVLAVSVDFYNAFV